MSLAFLAKREQPMMAAKICRKEWKTPKNIQYVHKCKIFLKVKKILLTIKKHIIFSHIKNKNNVSGSS